MTLPELKSEVQKYQYLEDTNIIDVSLASIIATRLKIGNPIWLIIIGASSGGKSQILRPLALSDTKFMHRVDDLTENTFLSGMKLSKKDEAKEPSLLHRIGKHGMIVISDLTVIFSKAEASMSAILSQFRMIYDGEMTKMVGTSGDPLTWEGELGILAGSTPSIYRNFETVSDMGERFIYYRMKEYDTHKATKLALGRKLYGKELDTILGGLYEQYLKETVATANQSIIIGTDIEERIIEVASLAEKIRTSTAMDWKGDKIVRIPVPAMPMRVALQLIAITKGLAIMRGGKLDENDLSIIDWLAYSLANEEKRACLKIICSIAIDTTISTSAVADRIGLDTDIVRNFLQSLAAVGILKRDAGGAGEGLVWKIARDEDYITLRRINKITIDSDEKGRTLTHEEKNEETEATEIWFNADNPTRK